MNNTERIAEIKERCEASAPGPWIPDTYGRFVQAGYGSWDTVCECPTLNRSGRDADFIAHSREDIPYLLSEVDRLTQGIKDTGKECTRRYDEIQRLTAELEQKTRELEQSIKLPCKVGDKIFSFRWNIKNEKYEVYTSEIKNVRYDSKDGCVMVSDGERFNVWGKRAFPTCAEAEAALSAEGVSE